jgi:hypothetical protein
MALSLRIEEFHLIADIMEPLRGDAELSQIILASVKKETAEPAWLRRKYLATDKLMHKFTDYNGPSVRKCLVAVIA